MTQERDPYERTLKKLQTAFANAAAASATYTAYAEKAASEGQVQAAKLFRASVRSEPIRARAYAAILRAE